MGAPKQRWTPEEEAALKAGVAKYGAGKWSTILKDPEFSNVLYSRSNVDLKDKWRNVNVAANGWGSRHRARVSLKNNQQTSKQDELALSTIDENEVEIVDAKPLAVFSETSENACPKIPISRLDNLILEAITKLKEPRGSSRTTIAVYIEERYLAPPNLEKLLAATLKLLTENGKLIKVKHQYRIAPPSMLSDAKKDSSPLLTGGKQKKDSMLPDAKKGAFPLLLGGKQKKDSTPSIAKKDPSPLLLGEKQKNAPKVEKNEFKILTKSQIDAELEKMKSMTAQEAAAAAAQAVAEAEAAIAEAEEAAREAEKAEAEAEAAQVFAEAAMKALKRRTVCA